MSDVLDWVTLTISTTQQLFFLFVLCCFSTSIKLYGSARSKLYVLGVKAEVHLMGHKH